MDEFPHGLENCARRARPAFRPATLPPTMDRDHIGSKITFPEDYAMPLSGEAIRLMNYIDDVAVTLRRVLAFIPTLTAEERARVHEHLKHSRPNAEDIAKALSE